MPQHHKVAPLSDAAFRLHVTAMAWSVEGKTDGRIPLGVPRTLTCAPRGSALAKVLSELVTAKVWLSLGGDGYEIHDFLQWNLSAKEVAARSEAKAIAGQAGGRARVKHLLESRLLVAQAESKPLSLPLPLPKSLPERDPPTPSVFAPQGLDRDISSDDLASFAPDPVKKPRKIATRTQWRRFPPDFVPDDSHRKIAAELGLSLAQQLTLIRDHEFVKPKSDAAATLRTWLRNAPKFGAPTLGTQRAHRSDPRNEAQDRNADHDTRERLEASAKVRGLLEMSDKMKAGQHV